MPGATISRSSVPYQGELLRQFEGFYTTMMVSVLASARQLGLSYPVALGLAGGRLDMRDCAGLLGGAAHRRSLRSRLRAGGGHAAGHPYAFNYDMTALGAALVWIMVGRLCHIAPRPDPI